MRFGYWLPVFGGWLRNVDDEGMAPTEDVLRTLAQKSEGGAQLEERNASPTRSSHRIANARSRPSCTCQLRK